VCPDEGRAMRSSALRRQAQRFGRRHNQPPIEFPCSAPQRDGKSPKMTGSPANVGWKERAVLHPRKILAWIVFAFLSFAPWSGQTVAQTCSWQGTAPLCAGECGAGESEQSRARTDPGLIEKTSGARISFGSDCLTGTKALCCKTPHATCRWSGTAPFCAGECKGNETKEAPPEGSSSGASCWTGSKVYCCTFSPVSSVPQRLVTEAEGVIYAITQNNDLMWFRHDGRNDGTFRWESNEGKKVGSGWDVKHVFSGMTLAP
jgi:hypothetical protein